MGIWWRIMTKQTRVLLRLARIVRRVPEARGNLLSPMLYNCGMIFFILSFFVGYILSFSLVRLWTVRLLVQVFTLVRGWCDNHKCHNKNPRWEIGLGCEWRHTRKRWAGNFGDFWKKHLVEIWTWVRAVHMGSTGCAACMLGQMEQSA